MYELLTSEGLGRFYDLGGGQGSPATSATSARRARPWLDALEAEAASSGSAEAVARLTLDVQGLHCSACVWLLETLFARQPGGLSILVNPALGKVLLETGRGFSLRHYVESVERFGYRLGPSLKDDRSSEDGLLLRMGVCIALAMNAMIFAFALYAGLDSGPTFRLFHGLELGLGTLSVLVGGSWFFRSAFLALRRGVLHLDLPIALGIALAFGSSAYAYARGSSATYFDTLTVFIALMLVGRWLQERVLERNRRALLASDGAEGLLTRRLEEGRVVVLRCTEVRAGDTLLIAPSDLVPVDGELLDPRATVSLDWINGESAPRDVGVGSGVPAGAFNAGDHAFALRATTAFEASPVMDLLRITRPRGADEARATPFWRRFAKIYVAAVLLVAGLGFAGWVLVTGDVGRALGVTAGVLIVTCPCAFGIATPLAYELAQAGLRRAGLFVRSAGFLDRVPEVRQVVFDKTGTLTTGDLTLRDPAALGRLSISEATALYNMTVRSAHPKSVAVAKELARRADVRFEAGLTAREAAGQGVTLTRDGQEHRLGSVGDDLVFTVNGAPRLTLTLDEDPRPDAATEVRALEQDGYEVWILSGDAPSRVQDLAVSLGVRAERALGGQSPAAKAAFLDDPAHGRALMIGDGLNDSLAVERAFCSGTPAIDRPFLPARTDFYFTTPGLRPVALGLRVARHLQRVTRRNLAIAVAYNVASVGLAWAGLLSPLVCAVVMPVSSLTVVGLTLASLSQGSRVWRS